MRALTLPLGVLTLSALTWAGCSAGKSAARAEPGERAVLRYFPLHVGDTWVYQDTRLGKTQNMEVSVVRQDGDARFVATSKPAGVVPLPGHKLPQVTFEVRPRGIFDGSRYVLEEPLEVGHTWMAIPSVHTTEKFKLVALDGMVRVPAGSFNECAQVRSVVEEPKKQQMVTDVWFCPGVGMAQRTVRVTAPGREDILAFDLKLLSYRSGGKLLFPRGLGE